MKVMYLTNAITHYYNLVLSRLAKESGIDLVVIAPGPGGSKHVGEGVYQTKNGIDFKLVELEEQSFLRIFSRFKGLDKVILDEKPDVIISIAPYLASLKILPLLIYRRYQSQSRVILKDIPMGSDYTQRKSDLQKERRPISSLPPIVSQILYKLRIQKYFRLALLWFERSLLNFPDAHVNYVEAKSYWRSYSVPDHKVFVTRNSPDTDQLLKIMHELSEGNRPSILPANQNRIIHVGRLVAWKNVDILIAAVANIKKELPDIELLIVGDGPEEMRLKALAKKLNATTSIKFLGGIYDPYLLGQYFLASSVYVLAGMGGLSINEAMCFGKPILCSVGDGTEKFLVHEGFNGYYFKEGNQSDLEVKISTMLKSPQLLKDMGARSLDIIRNEVNINTVIQGYKAALDYVSMRGI
jgi:glycosyltransferase involved in cell wall biosynthesis